MKASGPLTSAHDALLPLLQLLRAHGVTDTAITDATGFDPSTLSDPFLRVPLGVIDWMWSRTAELTQDPAIGLNLLDAYPDNHMHFVAHLAMRASTIAGAIRQWRDYGRLVCDADEITFTLDDAQARLEYRLLDPLYESRFIAEHYLSTAITYGRRFSGRDFKARRVEFRHADPGYPDVYRAMFGCAPLFECDTNALVFDPAVAAYPQVTANPYLASILESQASAMEASRDAPDTRYRVTRQIATALARGLPVTLGRVASELATSERSLSRALKAEGHTFSELADDIRHSLARRYLDQGLSIAQTAYLLGFADPSALNHALARWAGTA